MLFHLGIQYIVFYFAAVVVFLQDSVTNLNQLKV